MESYVTFEIGYKHNSSEIHLGCFIYQFFFFLKIVFIIWEGAVNAIEGNQAVGGAERGEVGSLLSREPDAEFDPRTQASQ